MAQPYPDVWVKKMKRVFSWLDDQKKGYITLEMMNDHDMIARFLGAFPTVEKKKLIEQNDYSWKVLFNNDQDVAPDYHLTEEQFIKNMWAAISRPSLEKEITKFTIGILDQMDLDQKDRVTKAEYLKLITSFKFANEEQAIAAFQSIDTDEDGMVEFDEIVKAKCFFLTDVSDELHPLNQLLGPSESD